MSTGAPYAYTATCRVLPIIAAPPGAAPRHPLPALEGSCLAPSRPGRSRSPLPEALLGTHPRRLAARLAAGWSTHGTDEFALPSQALLGGVTMQRKPLGHQTGRGESLRI